MASLHQSSFDGRGSNDSVTTDISKVLRSPIIVFSPELVDKLGSSEVRLPATYVGVRRVRASSKVTRDAFLKENSSHTRDVCNGSSAQNHPERTDSVVYKVTNEDGTERRMTHQEKKLLKFQLRKRKQEEKKRQKLLDQEHQQQQQSSKDGTNNDRTEKTTPITTNAYNSKASSTTPLQAKPEKEQQLLQQQKQYFQLSVNAQAIERELAELRGDRGIPPIILSSPMVEQAVKLGMFVPDVGMQNQISSSTATSVVVSTDDDLATQWAQHIQNSMTNAHDLRSKDPSRPMAYQLIPECWTRLRPSTPVANENNENGTVTTNTSGDDDMVVITEKAPSRENDKNNNNSKDWSTITTRPTASVVPNQNEDMSAVFDQLYRLKDMNISCGAKFGCDFLLYNDNREKCHAFAGLRVLISPNSSSSNTEDETDHRSMPSFPTLSPYDLYGYVRGLNTAGKLALLATVVRTIDHEKNTTKRQVLFIDLALEKILSAPTHQQGYKKRRRGGGHMQKRKDIGLNLAKKKS